MINLRPINDLLITPHPTRLQANTFMGAGFALILILLVYDVVTWQLNPGLFTVLGLIGGVLMVRGASLYVKVLTTEENS